MLPAMLPVFKRRVNARHEWYGGCVYVGVWEGRWWWGGGVECVHVTEERGWGWRVYTDIGDNESWHTAKLHSREKTIVHTVFMCACMHDVHMCKTERRR